MMLTAIPNTSIPSSPQGLWFPGKKFEGLMAAAPPPAPMSARAEQIAKSREEMLGLLIDLPESDYELSLTDLVEKRPAVDGPGSNKKTNTLEEEASKEGRKNMRRSSKQMRKRSSSTGSDGVLLNVYMPTSLTRSFTWSCGSGRRCSGGAKERTTSCTTRDKEQCAAPSLLGCLPAIWDKGRGKHITKKQ